MYAGRRVCEIWAAQCPREACICLLGGNGNVLEALTPKT